MGFDYLDILVFLIGVAVVLFALYAVIKTAINHSNLCINAEIQSQLLATIALKSGATRNEIEECFK